MSRDDLLGVLSKPNKTSALGENVWYGIREIFTLILSVTRRPLLRARKCVPPFPMKIYSLRNESVKNFRPWQMYARAFLILGSYQCPIVSRKEFWARVNQSGRKATNC
jgi:hypothetical protein